jgi:hypothetical protein
MHPMGLYRFKVGVGACYVVCHWVVRSVQTRPRLAHLTRACMGTSLVNTAIESIDREGKERAAGVDAWDRRVRASIHIMDAAKRKRSNLNGSLPPCSESHRAASPTHIIRKGAAHRSMQRTEETKTHNQKMMVVYSEPQSFFLWLYSVGVSWLGHGRVSKPVLSVRLRMYAGPARSPRFQ